MCIWKFSLALELWLIFDSSCYHLSDPFREMFNCYWEQHLPGMVSSLPGISKHYFQPCKLQLPPSGGSLIYLMGFIQRHVLISQLSKEHSRRGVSQLSIGFSLWVLNLQCSCYVFYVLWNMVSTWLLNCPFWGPGLFLLSYTDTLLW